MPGTEFPRGRSFFSLAALGENSSEEKEGMQPFVSPVAKAIFVARFLFAISLLLYVILWYICRDPESYSI